MYTKTCKQKHLGVIRKNPNQPHWEEIPCAPAGASLFWEDSHLLASILWFLDFN